MGEQLKEFKSQLIPKGAKIFFITLGGFIFAFSVNGFFVPHMLLSTGVNGISLLINYLTGIPVWLMVISINIPIFIAAWILVGRKFFYLSAYGMLSFTFFLWFTSTWQLNIQNELLAAVAGGALCGVGLGLMLRQGGSKGGMDIVARILNKFYCFSYSAVSGVINAIIIIIMAVMFSLELALLTFAAIFTLHSVAEAMLSGFSKSVTVLVLSRKKNNIVKLVSEALNRRASVLQNIEDERRPKEILMFIIQTRELARLKDIILSEDKDASISIIDTKEVRGGFERKGLY